MRLEGSFIIKTSVLYCTLAAAFSLVGVLFAEKGGPQYNPLMSLSIQEVTGHLAWGLLVGIVTLSLRYIILSGLFALLIDSDHLIGLLHIDAMSRMSHSVFFGLIAVVVMMFVFGKRNYLLGAIAFSAVLAHISYDTFTDHDATFPFFAPFYNHQIEFQNIDWILFEVTAIALIGFVIILTKRSTVKAQIR